jgi:hypothetical protein
MPGDNLPMHLWIHFVKRMCTVHVPSKLTALFPFNRLVSHSPMIRTFGTDGLRLCSLLPSIAPIEAEAPSYRMRDFSDSLSSGPKGGPGRDLLIVRGASNDDMPLHGQSHAAVYRAPIPSGIAVSNVYSPSTYEESFQPPKLVRVDSHGVTSPSQQAVDLYQVPFDCPGSYDPSVNVTNEFRERHRIISDSAIALGRAEPTPTPLSPPSTANGTIKSHSSNKLTFRSANTGGSHPHIPLAMGLHQSGKGSGSSSGNRRDWTEGVSALNSIAFMNIDSLMRPTFVQHIYPKSRPYLRRRSKPPGTRQPYRWATAIWAFRVTSAFYS